MQIYTFLQFSSVLHNPRCRPWATKSTTLDTVPSSPRRDLDTVSPRRQQTLESREIIRFSVAECCRRGGR